jgi:hypothetical protein
MPIALLSVSDKTGLLPFAQALVQNHGYKLLSTGGTSKMLRDAGLPVTDVSEHTGFPEIMEGRVKTLHPKVHGGLLCRRDSHEHLDEAKKHGIELIDLVVVNLYPFEATVAKPNCSFEDAIENIDIGGPSMLRSAAKNHASVSVVTDPADYERVLAAMGNPAALAELRRERPPTTPPSPTTSNRRPSPASVTSSACPRATPPPCPSPSASATAKTRTSRLRSTARSTRPSTSSRARSSATTTFWTSPPRPTSSASSSARRSAS